MKILWSWLNTHLSLTASIDDVLYALTHSGTEAEKTDAYAWTTGFQVAQVISTSAHPNAENLKICDVSLGNGDTVSIVCGAKNVRPQLKTIVALPGCFLPGSKTALTPCVLRGVASQGMLCSPQELAMEDIWGTVDGLVELPDSIPVGTPLRHFLPSQDALLHLNVTPNRGDLFSHKGVARELIALGLGQPFSLGTETEGTSCTAFSDLPPMGNVHLDTSACSFFQLCRIEHVQQGTTPSWMRRRLVESGIACHGPCVDFTNHAAEDNGQPLHVFDADAIVGSIRMRLSTSNEPFQALDGETYLLPEGCVVISDDEGILSLAGIMGGMRGRCQGDTRTILVESAAFDPISIARSGRLTRLHSASRSRFERGVDPLFCPTALDQAALWIAHNTHGSATACSRLGTLTQRQPILFDPRTIATRCGAILPMKTVIQRLESWGSAVTAVGTQGNDQENIPSHVGGMPDAKDCSALSEDTSSTQHMLSIQPPSWRWDWQDSWDCATEVLRGQGYTDIPSVPLPVVPMRVSAQKNTGTVLPALDYPLMWALRDFWISQGFYEVVTWSFVSAALAKPFFEGTETAWQALHLTNPMSKDWAVLRPSILPSLVNIANHHHKYNLSLQPIFEIGPRFSGLSPADQHEHLTALWPVKKTEAFSPVLSGSQKEWSFYEIKSVLDRCVRALGLKKTHWIPGGPAWYHPGQSARLIHTINGQEKHLATIGKIHPRLNIPAFGAELHLNAWQRSSEVPEYAIPLLQPVAKDLSFYIPETSLVGTVLANIQALGLAELERIIITDMFQDSSVSGSLIFKKELRTGKNDASQSALDASQNAYTSGSQCLEKTPASTRSITIRCFFQPFSSAFSSAQLHHLMQNVADCAEKNGWMLRGSLEDIQKSAGPCVE